MSDCQNNVMWTVTVCVCRLSGCMVTEKGCDYVASALSSNPSHLRQLDLSYNNPGESGVQLLSEKLEDPNCALGKLKYVEQEQFLCFIILTPLCLYVDLLNFRGFYRTQQYRSCKEHLHQDQF